MSVRARLITSDHAEAWRRAVLTALPDDLSDIPAGFDPGYAALFAPDGGFAALVSVTADGGGFALPIVASPIPGTDHFDLQSPYGYAGCIASVDDRGFVADTWQAAVALLADHRFVAGFLRFDPVLATERFATAPCDVERAGQVVLRRKPDMDDPEAVIATYRSDTRNRVRKAIKSGVVVRTSRGAKDVAAFAAMYETTMTRVDADDFYRFDESFFTAVMDVFGDHAALLMADMDGTPVAGALVMCRAGVLTYFLSATVKEARNIGAAHLLRHEAVMRMGGFGASVINFGGGTTGREDDSLFRFKAGFSDDVAPFSVGRLVIDRLMYDGLMADWRMSVPAEMSERYGNRVLAYRMRPEDKA